MLISPLSPPLIIIIGLGVLISKNGHETISQKNLFTGFFLILISFFFFYINQQDYRLLWDFVPQLSLLIYPIGWLSETQVKYNHSQTMPILYGVGCILLLTFISWKIRKRYITLLLWGTVLLSMFSFSEKIHLSQPLQNPSTLNPLVPFCLAISSLCGIIQKQPRWKTSIVKITTLLCIIMMGGQIFLNGLYIYSAIQEQKITEKILKEVEKNNIDEFILFPSSMEYRWHTLNIFAVLIKNKFTPNSSLHSIKVIPFCKLYLANNPNVTVRHHCFNGNSLALSIYPIHTEDTVIYPSESMLPAQQRETKFINYKNNSIVEFLKEEQSENILITATDKKLSKFLFLWDNTEKTYNLFICE